MLERELVFESRVPAAYRVQLEAIVFFNRRQERVRSAIVAAIERYGSLEIVESDSGLRVRVSGLPDVQCLFAIERMGNQQRPVGVIVYVRDSFERITVLHMGVADEYAAGGPFEGRRLLLRLVHAVRTVARRTSGIRHVELSYTQRGLRALTAVA